MFFVTFACSYWGVMITLYRIHIFQQCFLTRAYHYTHCGFPALVLCLASLELWQRWSLTSTCEILSRQALCVSEWKTLTTYSWAVRRCSFLQIKIGLMYILKIPTICLCLLLAICEHFLQWALKACAFLHSAVIRACSRPAAEMGSVCHQTKPSSFLISKSQGWTAVFHYQTSPINHIPCVIPTEM